MQAPYRSDATRDSYADAWQDLRRTQQTKLATIVGFVVCSFPLAALVHHLTGTALWMFPYMVFLPLVAQPPRFTCPRCGKDFISRESNRWLGRCCANCGIWAGTPNLVRIDVVSDRPESEKLSERCAIPEEDPQQKQPNKD
jgi:hypothetical protein